jgi:sulfur carrier protein
MQIVINGQPHELEESLNIEQILDKLDINRQSGVAVAHNRTVLSKGHFAATTVKDGDQLEIIHATAGG